MGCKCCSKSICVEEAASCKGYCLGCYLILSKLKRPLVEVFQEAFGDRPVSDDRLGRMGLKRKENRDD